MVIQTGRIYDGVVETPTNKRVIWRTDFDTLDDSEITGESGNDDFTITYEASGPASATNVAKLNIDTTTNDSGIRLRQDDVLGGGDELQNHPTTVWYKARVYYDDLVTWTGFWNIFQTKQAWWDGGAQVTKESFFIRPNSNGDGGFDLRWHIDHDGSEITGNETDGSAPAGTLVVDTWHEITMRVVWSTDDAVGRCTIWVDGTQVVDTQRRTEYSGANYEAPNVTRNRHQWTVNNYGSATTPAQFDVYVDYMEAYGEAASPKELGTAASASTSAASSHSVSHTLEAGSDRRVFVVAVFENSGTGALSVSSATYGGQSMALVTDGTTSAISETLTTSRTRVEVWDIKEADLPSDGSNSAVVNLSGSASELLGLFVVAVEAADQGTNVDLVVDDAQASSEPDLDVTTNTPPAFLISGVAASNGVVTNVRPFSDDQTLWDELVETGAMGAASWTHDIEDVDTARIQWGWGSSQARIGHVVVSVTGA